MTKINFPKTKPVSKPLKDYPDGQFFVIQGQGIEYLVIKSLCGDQYYRNLIAVDDGNRLADNLEDCEQWIKKHNYIIIPVDVEINVL